MRSWVAWSLLLAGMSGCSTSESESDKSEGEVTTEDDTVEEIIDDTDPVEDTDETDVEEDTEDTDDTDEREDTDDTYVVEKTWSLEVNITADDSWQMWIDGEPAGAATGWSVTDVHEAAVVLNQDGPHVIAVHAYDLYNVISGFIAYVTVDGQKVAVTGDGKWRMVGEEPEADWFMPWYNDDHWTQPNICAVTTPWGSNPTDLTKIGAQWVWDNSNCYVLGATWFRLEFQIP
jgi:hypothetical protein